MARTKLISGSNSDDLAVYTTAPFTPAANRLVLAFVVSQRQDNGDPAVPSVVGNGLIWELVDTVTLAERPERRLCCFRSMAAAPTAGALTFDFKGEQQELCEWSVVEYDGVATGGSGNGSAAIPQVRPGRGKATNLSVALSSPLADPAKSMVVGALMLDDKRAVEPGGGFVEIDELQEQSPDCTLQTQDRTGGDTTAAWTWPDVQDAAALVLEIAPAGVVPPGGGTGTGPGTDAAQALLHLARRFEPILYFHPDERFFPCDAKRYLEHCALWSAQVPFDSRDGWGGAPGQPFPRTPLPGYGHGQIAGVAGEPGSLLGDGNSAISTDTEEHFLDLTGWKDDTGAVVEPGVTQSSRNTYSNRDEIARRYNNPDADGGIRALRDSRFWYHVELLDIDALKQVAGTVREPDLGRLFALVKNPALLNYYLFFPAHDESLEVDCTNIEAAEFASFAGGWACISILLERDSPDDLFRPKYIGHSSHVQPKDSISAADPADAAKRVIMRVSPFGDAQTFEEHPKLFVARGTHSLYFAAGSFDIAFAQGTAPEKCGRIEPMPSSPSPRPNWLVDEYLPVFLAKLALGGVFIGPTALFPAFYGALLEFLPMEPQTFVFADPDQPAPDITPTPANAKVVRPKNVDPKDGSTFFQSWQSDTLDIAGRHYDFRVDRAAQRWWPSLDGAAGFRGRWGPRVATDPDGHRAGMAFPPFPRMFLMAAAEASAKL